MIKRLIVNILCLAFVVLAQPQVESGYTEYPASGMLLGSKDMSLYVVFVYGNSKAESVGIKAGDFIIQIQQDQEAMFIEPIYAANMINAYPVGTEITIGVERENKQYTFNFSREENKGPDILLAARQGDKWGYIDLSGSVFIPPIFDQAEPFNDGLALVKIDGQNKYINKMGQTVLVVKSGYKPYSFSEEMAMYESNGKYGYINKNGDEVIKAQYNFANDFSESVALAQTKDKWGYITKSNEFVIPAIFYSGYDFSEELAAVRNQDLKFGYIFKTGNTAISHQYDDATSFKDGYALVDKDNKQYFINKKGGIVITPNEKVITLFYDGLAAVLKNNKFGFIDTTGKLAIPCKYDFTQGFSEGLCAVVLNKKYGYIDKQGNMVISPQYDAANIFQYGLAQVSKDSLMAYIDKTGKIIWQEKK